MMRECDFSYVDILSNGRVNIGFGGPERVVLPPKHVVVQLTDKQALHLARNILENVPAPLSETVLAIVRNVKKINRQMRKKK